MAGRCRAPLQRRPRFRTPRGCAEFHECPPRRSNRLPTPSRFAYRSGGTRWASSTRTSKRASSRTALLGTTAPRCSTASSEARRIASRREDTAKLAVVMNALTEVQFSVARRVGELVEFESATEARRDSRRSSPLGSNTRSFQGMYTMWEDDLAKVGGGSACCVGDV